MTQLYAFPWSDKDRQTKFSGDSDYYPAKEHSVPCDGDETFALLTEKWLRHTGYEALEEADGEEVWCWAEPTGFWVFTEEALETALSVWPEGGVGNDSTCYALNAACKRVLDGLAVKEVTP